MCGCRNMNKFTLSNYIAGKYPGEITPLKLQKLLYYCYVWQMVAKDKKFDATFKAWTHGPVEPDIYKAYKKYGRNAIKAKPTKESGDPLLDFILDSYAVYSAIELSKTTHFESPWKKYRENGEVIADQDFIDYYSNQEFAKNFPLGKSAVYYPPKTSSHYSFTFDMEKDYAPVFDSLDQYVNSFKQEKKRLAGILSSHGFKY